MVESLSCTPNSKGALAEAEASQVVDDEKQPPRKKVRLHSKKRNVITINITYASGEKPLLERLIK